MRPLPTRPIDDAGPLNGNTPPILISVAVTPGSSAANAGPLKSKARAARLFHFANMAVLPDAHPSGHVIVFCCVTRLLARHRAERIAPRCPGVTAQQAAGPAAVEIGRLAHQAY